jgi:hypothetical protein
MPLEALRPLFSPAAASPCRRYWRFFERGSVTHWGHHVGATWRNCFVKRLKMGLAFRYTEPPDRALFPPPISCARSADSPQDIGVCNDHPQRRPNRPCPQTVTLPERALTGRPRCDMLVLALMSKRIERGRGISERAPNRVTLPSRSVKWGRYLPSNALLRLLIVTCRERSPRLRAEDW